MRTSSAGSDRTSSAKLRDRTEELRARSLRTLDLYLSTLLEATGGKLPSGFVVTLPKITTVEQIDVLVLAFETRLPGSFLDAVAFRDQPFRQRPGLHRGRQRGHEDVGRHGARYR